jgi:hypothetical protein
MYTLVFTKTYERAEKNFLINTRISWKVQEDT